jgi:hypothetical protein
MGNGRHFGRTAEPGSASAHEKTPGRREAVGTRALALRNVLRVQEEFIFFSHSEAFELAIELNSQRRAMEIACGIRYIR